MLTIYSRGTLLGAARSANGNNAGEKRGPLGKTTKNGGLREGEGGKGRGREAKISIMGEEVSEEEQQVVVV